jgi:hypothetical protein
LLSLSLRKRSLEEIDRLVREALELVSLAGKESGLRGASTEENGSTMRIGRLASIRAVEL